MRPMESFFTMDISVFQVGAKIHREKRKKGHDLLWVLHFEFNFEEKQLMLLYPLYSYMIHVRFSYSMTFIKFCIIKVCMPIK